MKPEWFKLVENDPRISVKPKNHVFVYILIGVLIGGMGSYFLVPSKVVDKPVEAIISTPVQTIAPSIPKPDKITPFVPAIKNPVLNPSGDDDSEDEENDD
jgi:hypothetical protein